MQKKTVVSAVVEIWKYGLVYVLHLHSLNLLEHPYFHYYQLMLIVISIISHVFRTIIVYATCIPVSCTSLSNTSSSFEKRGLCDISLSYIYVLSVTWFSSVAHLLTVRGRG